MEVSKHAYSRAKERLSWSRGTIERMANRAWEIGINPEKGPKKVAIWLKAKSDDYVGIRGYRIYGDVLYIFSWFTLITVYRVPGEIQKIVGNPTNGPG